MRCKFVCSVLLLSALVLLGGCKKEGTLSCEDGVRHAYDAVQLFEAEGDSALLHQAMASLDSAQSRRCRYSVFQPKLMLYMMMGEFNAGINYVEGFAEHEFTYPYQRDVYITSLRALAFEHQGDTAAAHATYKAMADEVAAYYDEHRERSVLFDWLSLQVNWITPEETEALITGIKNSGDYANYEEQERDYLERLLERSRMSMVQTTTDSVVVVE